MPRGIYRSRTSCAYLGAAVVSLYRSIGTPRPVVSARSNSASRRRQRPRYGGAYSICVPRRGLSLSRSLWRGSLCLFCVNLLFFAYLSRSSHHHIKKRVKTAWRLDFRAFKKSVSNLYFLSKIQRRKSKVNPYQTIYPRARRIPHPFNFAKIYAKGGGGLC